MNGFSDFITNYQFSQMNGLYYGMFSDMHVVLKEDGDCASAYLYLDLPPQGRKARRALENALNEKGERYEAKIAESAPEGFLKIDLKNDEDAGVNLDRFLTECDLLLRPYGREMGLLCAYCRKEMQDQKPEYKIENGLVIPVCPDCIHLESAGKAKKADNRRTIEKKRMAKGLMGALIGSVISVFIWMFTGLGGGFLLSVISALLSVFLIKLLFEKMSRVPNRLTSVTVLAFAMIALIIGSAVGYTAKTNEYRESMRASAAYMLTYEAEANDPYAESIIKAAKTGEYDNITVMEAFYDPAYYESLIVPAIAVVFASFGADSINLKSRRRR